MRLRIEIALYLLYVIFLAGFMGIAFNLMNQPSTAKFYSGVALLLSLFVVGPTTIHSIVRRFRK